MTGPRPPIIGVMGGGEVPREISSLARALGHALAAEGWVVLNGGRNAGVMAAVSEGAATAGGLVVGVLPDRDLDRAAPHLTIPIRTGLGDGRNIINILSSDVVVALPGGLGTLSEMALALKNRKPLLLLGWTEPPPLPLEGAMVESFSRVSELVTRIKALVKTII